MRRRPRPPAITGVFLAALGADGRVLRELPIGLLDRTPLHVPIPEGTRSLRLTGTTAQLPRYRIVLGPHPHVIPLPTRRRWKWRC